jgi:hypothetical protein
MSTEVAGKVQSKGMEANALPARNLVPKHELNNDPDRLAFA